MPHPVVTGAVGLVGAVGTDGRSRRSASVRRGGVNSVHKIPERAASLIPRRKRARPGGDPESLRFRGSAGEGNAEKP